MKNILSLIIMASIFIAGFGIGAITQQAPAQKEQEVVGYAIRASDNNIYIIQSRFPVYATQIFVDWEKAKPWWEPSISIRENRS